MTLASFAVNVGQPEQNPTTSGIPDQSYTVGETSATLDVSSYFQNENAGSSLSYAVAENSNPALFSTQPTFAGGTLSMAFTASMLGSAELVIEATDTAGSTVNATFDVSINPPAPQVTSLALANPTGAGGATTDPSLSGAVNVAGNTDPIVVEFDLHGDGQPDGSTEIDDSDSFSYAASAMPTGVDVVQARAVDLALGLTGSWTALTFTLEAAPAPSIASLSLENNLGTSNAPLASDPTFGGQFVGDYSLADEEIEIDLNGDGVPDDSTYTDASGSFTYTPQNLTAGPVTVEARPVVYDVGNAQHVTGAWSTLTFTLENSSQENAASDAIAGASAAAQAINGQIVTAIDSALAAFDSAEGESVMDGQFNVGVGSYDPAWNLLDPGGVAQPGQNADQAGFLGGVAGGPLSLNTSGAAHGRQLQPGAQREWPADHLAGRDGRKRRQG